MRNELSQQNELDERLRSLFEPEPETVARVRRGALVARTEPSRWPRRLAVGAATVAAIAALWWASARPRDEAVVAEAFSFSSSDGVVAVRARSGETWLIRSRELDAEAASSIMILRGDQP